MSTHQLDNACKNNNYEKNCVRLTCSFENLKKKCMDYTTENKSKSSDITVPLALTLFSGPGGDPSWICLNKYKRDITKLHNFF